MYFTLSKIFWLIFMPSNLIILTLALGGWLMLMRRRIIGSIVFLVGFVGLVIGAVSSLPDRALETLETRFPRCDDQMARVDGVIVLGGATNLIPSVVWDRFTVNEAGSRLIMMADLARRYPDAKIVFTGGYGSMFGKPISEADVIAKNISLFGLDPSRIIFETKSRNTIENALLTRDLVEPKPEEKWLLVTSGSHMPRAYGMFRKAGFPVEACVSDYASKPGYEDDDLNFDIADRLRLLNRVSREYIGLIAARLYDYTGLSRHLR
jgi:uncharacterized SAM-binding protein YcdF (DUF218 family)